MAYTTANQSQTTDVHLPPNLTQTCHCPNDHYLTNSNFSLEGEIAAYNFAAKRAPSLDIQKILYSEIVLLSAAYLYLGYAATPKIVFP